MIAKEELFSAADARLAELTEEESEELREIFIKIKAAIKVRPGYSSSIFWTHDVKTSNIYASHILDVLRDLGYQCSLLRSSACYASEKTYYISWDLKEGTDGNS